MSKILFVTRKDNTNPAINNKLQQFLDCDFINAGARDIIAAVEKNNVKLVVVFLSRLSAEEELEVNKFLLNSGSTPIILAGERYELEKYFEKTSARIVKYIITPILLSNFVQVIKECLGKIEGNITEPQKQHLEESDLVKQEPKHILVVDDEPIMLRTISNWLNDLFIVSVAKSGAAALQYLSKETPDLILLDYNMPVCDGIQTLKMMRAEENLKDIPVFFLTGVDDVELVKKALELKPQGYILKSEGADHLVSRIEKYL